MQPGYFQHPFTFLGGGPVQGLIKESGLKDVPTGHNIC